MQTFDGTSKDFQKKSKVFYGVSKNFRKFDKTIKRLSMMEKSKRSSCQKRNLNGVFPFSELHVHVLQHELNKRMSSMEVEEAAVDENGVGGSIWQKTALVPGTFAYN